MGFFGWGNSNIPLYTSSISENYENLGLVEGMYEYDSNANTQSDAVEKAKNELRRILNSIKADAAVNVRYACFPSNNVCTIIVYGDAIRFIK